MLPIWKEVRNNHEVNVLLYPCINLFYQTRGEVCTNYLCCFTTLCEPKSWSCYRHLYEGIEVVYLLLIMQTTIICCGVTMPENK